MNAEFQRIARKDKKTFPSDQCKEIEENNRMGKTRDLFKKMEHFHAKGTFHAKMGKLKDLARTFRKWQPTAIFLPRESHVQRSLVGCCP